MKLAAPFTQRAEYATLHTRLPLDEKAIKILIDGGFSRRLAIEPSVPTKFRVLFLLARYVNSAQTGKSEAFAGRANLYS